ncbi:MAG: ABC transporter permease [Planctomycetota bacterium]|nr:MAG: ABC transporter permease [Planctomycetota bacterium]REJ87426.1 MAG: ABC transporter permease [Planctomycetota bacterium]
MSLLTIAWRSIQQRALSSWLTGISMALGVALIVIVLVINSLTQRFFNNAAEGFHLIVGAKGGKMQLVLNTVFHMSQPIENVPYAYYQEFAAEDGEFGKIVDLAIPFCLGDTYKGFRVVGTVPELFDKNPYTWRGDDPVYYQFREGGRNLRDARAAKDFEVAAFEAVVGWTAARETGLEVGSKFEITHGVEGHTHDEDQFTVVGILEPTGTPNDRAVFVNMEGFYLLRGHALTAPAGEDDDDHEDRDGHEGHDHDEHEDHDHDEHADHDQDEHDHEGHEDHDHAEHEHEGHDHEDHDEHADHDHASGPRQPLPENQREVTAVLVRLAARDDLSAELAIPSLIKQINKGRIAQAVLPVGEVQQLLNTFVAPTRWVLLGLTVAIVVVACIGVMVSIYNSMAERSREIAVIRSLGARRETVMTIVILESVMLALLGGLGGVVAGHFLLGLFAPAITQHAGVPIEWWHLDVGELILVPLLIVLAALAGFLPALTAYRTDVAKALGNSP